ncbi:hypothetical protein ACXYTP_23640 [Tsukamurella ocularis]
MDELRALRDATLAEISSDSIADQYERGAILLGWEGLTDERATADADTLRVELRGVDRAPAHSIGSISTSLQNAVAYIGRYQRNPRLSPQSGLTRAERERFQIVQEAQVGGTLVFRVPAIPMPSAGMDLGTHPAAAGSAIRELIDTLPREDGDEWSSDGVLGSPPLIRKAVHDLSRAAAHLPEGLELDLFSDGGTESHAALSHARADELRRDLENRDDVVKTETRTGLLDGLRGTRRVFYLVENEDLEIAGAVDADMVREVEALEHQWVRVELETTQWVRKNGRLGRKGYRLLSIKSAPKQGEWADRDLRG